MKKEKSMEEVYQEMVDEGIFEMYGVEISDDIPKGLWIRQEDGTLKEVILLEDILDIDQFNETYNELSKGSDCF